MTVSERWKIVKKTRECRIDECSEIYYWLLHWKKEYHKINRKPSGSSKRFDDKFCIYGIEKCGNTKYSSDDTRGETLNK